LLLGLSLGAFYTIQENS